MLTTISFRYPAALPYSEPFSLFSSCHQYPLHPSFHEKIALIDNAVVYFGSLNILSQSDSSESMIAYRSPEIIQQMIKNFEINEVIQKYERSSDTGGGHYQNNTSAPVDAPTGNRFVQQIQRDGVLPLIEKSILSSVATKCCPACNTALILEKADNGLILRCPNAVSKDCVALPIPKRDVEKNVDQLAIPCDRCGRGLFRYRVGRHGPFLGCNQYPQCRNTLNISKMRRKGKTDRKPRSSCKT